MFFFPKISVILRFSRMATKDRKNCCCNPLNKLNHRVREKSQLRSVTKRLCEKFPSLLRGDKICDSCRKQLGPKPKTTEDKEKESDDLFDLDSSFGCDSFEEDYLAETANNQLQNIGFTPMNKRKLRTKKYQHKKLESVTTVLEKAGIHVHEATHSDCEILGQFKENTWLQVGVRKCKS